ncbi:MAG: chemotaxis protein CheC [Candidatus Omnitrophica bacterium]|nr:chemotaxis protein CheC [Candidatus Omnitrophota bacterium]MBU1924583.1 chemotaxis protein CheC [Candidatus Omnitrophota bacterium]
MSNLTDIQLDALREMGNIGSGNAATSLSQLITETVNISVPAVKIMPLKEVSFFLGGPEKLVYIVYLEVLREMQGTMLTIFTPESASFLGKKLFKKTEVDLQEEISQSALREVGSILCGSYLSALSQIVGITSVASVPVMASDMLGAVLDFILVEIGQVADEVILIETELLVAGTKLECSQLYLPKPEALEKILGAIGMGS